MCGVPLCLVPRALDRYFDLVELDAGRDAEEFVQPPPCSTCTLATRCHGVRRGYVALHGDGELAPVTSLDPRARAPLV
jgi:hypothetical protein